MFDRDPLSTVVRVSLPGSEFGDMMSVFRTWLDGQKIQPMTFKAAPDASGDDYTEEADRFRAKFGDASGAALAA